MTAPEFSGDARLTAFHAFETRHRLFDQLCDDWSIWRVLRRVVHREVTAEDQPAAAPGHRAPRFNGVVRRILQLTARMIAPPRADLLILSCTSALRSNSTSGYRDIYVDDLLDTGLTAFKIEARNSVAFNARSAEALYPARADAAAVDFLARVLVRLRPLPATLQDACALLSERLRTELGVSVPARWISGTIATTREQARIYEFVLRRVRPKAVVVIDTAEFPMLIACRRAGVPFIEIQHGVFTAEHPDAVPAVPGDQRRLLLPDRLASFGSYWKQLLTGAAMPAEHIVPVGNLLIDQMRERRAAREPNDGTLRLLVTTQGVATPELVAWLSAFAAGAPRAMRWKLHVKLHPAYEPSTEPYAELREYPQIEIVAGNEGPLTAELLANADLHMSISSTSHFDAISIGVPTIIIPLPSFEIIRSVADERSAFIARDPQDAWRIISTAPAVPEGGHGFAEPGYVGNLRALVDSVMLGRSGNPS